jgi:hypothetical protein
MVDLPQIEFDSYKGRSGKLMRDLAREMAPSRGVKELEDVEIEAKSFFEGRSVPEGLLDVIREFMEGIKADMTLSFTNKKAKA